MKNNAQKSSQFGFHLYFEHINNQAKWYLPYILAVMHSSEAVLPGVRQPNKTKKKYQQGQRGIRLANTGGSGPVRERVQGLTMRDFRNKLLL